MRYRKSGEIPGELRNVTISLRSGRWFVSILTRREIEVPEHPGGAVGIDMDVKRFIEPLNSFKRHEKALAKAQRRLSRKLKFSKNWVKAKARVQKIHHRIGNVRKNFLH